jgi:hypothetical protein
MTFLLAQVNIALTVAPFSDPAMRGLVDRVAEMNSLAGRSPGFVWRFVPPDDLSYLRPFAPDYTSYEPERVFFNLSVWTTPDALKDYVYRTAHLEMLKAKDRWILPADGPHLALWWVPIDHRPTVEEAREKLLHLKRFGPTSEAFTFGRLFPFPSLSALE